VDGTPQSHVDLDDPSYLSFEYVRRLGHVVDLVAEPGIPLSVVHLGAGALTLARYVEATRRGSRQRAVEISAEVPIKGVAVECEDDGVKFADNLVDIVPGELVRIGVTGASKDTEFCVRYLGMI